MFLKMASSDEKSLGATWTKEETGGEEGGGGNNGGNKTKIKEEGKEANGRWRAKKDGHMCTIHYR